MAVYLDIRTALTRIEQALVDAISLAYQWRRPAVDSLDALAALPSAPNKDGQLCFVTPEGVVYRFKRYSTNAEARPYVVQPSDLAASAPGRWERTTSTVTKGPNHFKPVNRVETGYAKQVLLWQGEGGSDAALDRMFGQTPSFLVRWTGVNIGQRHVGNPLGSVYSYDCSFEIWCFSKNYRPQNQALWGSDVESEQNDDSNAADQANDPGLNRMVGDIQYLLGTGATLGLSPAVSACFITGSTTIVHEDLDSREFVASIPLVVQAGLSIPDEDLVGLESASVQTQWIGFGEDAKFDTANYVAQGYRVFERTGLNGTPTPGVAYVNGQLISSQPGDHLFTASKDTYRYLLSDGSIFYIEVETNADEPRTPSGAFRLGLTQTSATDIYNDVLLADYIDDDGDPFLVPKQS